MFRAYFLPTPSSQKQRNGFCRPTSGFMRHQEKVIDKIPIIHLCSFFKFVLEKVFPHSPCMYGFNWSLNETATIH